MGTWYKPQEFFKRFFRKKDLREVCREKYGDDFVKMYDMVNDGIPIGNLGGNANFPRNGQGGRGGRVNEVRLCKL